MEAAGSTSGDGASQLTRRVDTVESITKGNRLPANRTMRRIGVFDAVSSLLVWVAVLVVAPITSSDLRPDRTGFTMAVFASAVTVAMFAHRGIYSTRPVLPKTDEISALLSSVAVGCGALAVLASFGDFPLGARELLLGGVAVTVLFALSRGIQREAAAAYDVGHNALLLGTGPEAAAVAQLLVDHPDAQLHLVGVLGDQPEANQHGLGHLWVGAADDLLATVRDQHIDTVIFSPNALPGLEHNKITRQLLAEGVTVLLSTGITRLNPGRLEARSLVHEPLLVVRRVDISMWQRAIKRAVDVAGATVMLIVLAPVLALIAIAVRLESKGPVFYQSQRYGRGAESFQMWKFRSMVVGADQLQDELADSNQRNGPIFKLTDDPRVTRVGRFLRQTSLDELPQFLNVLQGEMSLVGPRPALPAEEAAFAGEHRNRFRVRPGITGLWQVEARTNANFSAYRRLDLHYLENWTLRLDIEILLATAEQFAVDLLLLPIRLVRGSSGPDGVTPTASPAPEVTVDLRQAVPAAAVVHDLTDAATKGRQLPVEG